MDSMVYLWGIVMLICVIVEACTFSLVSIWFAVGALGGLIAALFGANEAIQSAIFLSISIITLLFTRPVFRKLLPGKYTPTNSELDIGEIATVLETINNSTGTGRVRLGDVNWSAISADGSVIGIGESVTVTAVGATTLTVRRNP
jgi:membrane protein implicated in regulation of membrane protease activity